MKGSTDNEELEPNARVREFVNVQQYRGEEHARQVADATAHAVVRVDELIEAGVLTEEQRRAAEWTLIAFATAGTPDGDARAERAVRAAIQPAAKQRRPTTDQRRAAVVAVLNDRLWRDNYTERTLRRIDPRFKGLSKETFDRAKDRSVHRFAANLSCACGAFGDGRNGGPAVQQAAIARAKAAFEQAARESSRTPRTRRSR